MNETHPTPKSYIFASLLTGVYDVNRNELLKKDDFRMIEEWYHSIVKLNLNAVIFHNTFSDKTVSTYQTEQISFLNVDYDGKLNPNVQRYLIYRDYINKHLAAIENVFVTDIADVVVVKNPFLQPLFIHHKATKIFCGDEPKTLGNEWMQEHSTNLRNNILGFAEYEEKYQHETLLNCGIIGGNVVMMQSLMEQLADIHQTYNIDNKTAFTGDMGAFNFVMRTEFNDQFLHGSPINTQFKSYETNRIDCWFRHK